jgi:hypothetical protein
MNRIATIALSIAATLVASGSAFAQDHAVKATVPFNFSVNGSWMPAGTYTIASEPSRANILNIASREQNVHQLAMGQVDSKDPGSAGELVFHKYGDRYFLSEIRYPNSSAAVHFAPTRTEKRAKEGTLEAGLRVDDEILIALN